MGTSHSAKAFADKIGQLATATRESQAAIVAEGAKATKATFLAAASSKGMRPGSKIAKKAWSVRYDLIPGVEPTALVRFTGPFHLVDRPTSPHDITPKGGRQQTRRGRGSRAKALRIGDSFAASASHPGTRGKHIFPAGREAAAKVVPKAMAAHQRAVWASVVK